MTTPQESDTTWSWLSFYSGTDDNDATLTDGKATNYGLWWIGLIVIYIVYYLMMVVAKPKVICSGKKLKEAIVEHCPIFFECYWPTFWAFNNHFMTVIRARWQRSPHIHYERHILELADGGQLAMDWFNMGTEDSAPGLHGQTSTSGQQPQPPGFDHEEEIKTHDETIAELQEQIEWHKKKGQHEEDTDLPVLLIMPGLTGSSQENYIRYLVKDGESQGFRPVVFNQRGNGGVDLLTPRTYSATNTEDLREVLNHIRSRYPNAPIVGMGVSLGAMLLTKYLAETGENSEIAGIIAISALWDSNTSSDVLEQFPNRQLYNWFLSSKMRNMVHRSMPKILRKFPTLPYDMEEILKGSVCSEFDRSCTIKVFGYSSIAEYYQDTSNIHRLHLVKRPMICVQAEDDPFAPQKTLPYSRFKENENTVLVTTTHGGHFGFLEGLLPFGMNWMNRVVQQSLCVLKHTAFQPLVNSSK